MIQSAIRDGRVSTHSIAPAQVIRGAGAWPQSLTAIQSLTRRPLLLGRSAATQSLRDELGRDLSGLGLSVIHQTLDHDCCEQDLQRLQSALSTHRCDAVIAAGGGKVLDAGKLLAHRRRGLHHRSAQCGHLCWLDGPLQSLQPGGALKAIKPSIAALICWSSTTTYCCAHRHEPWPAGSPMPWPSGTKHRLAAGPALMA